MIDEMADLIENFPGAANQTRCFLHILNLTAKSILQQFEIPKKKKAGNGNGNGGGDDDGDKGKKTLNKAMSELLAMANEIEDEPFGVDDVDDSEDSEGVDFEDNDKELEDEREDLSADEIAELEADLLPVRLMLTKVWTGQMTQDYKLKKISASWHLEHDEELVDYYSPSVEHEAERARTGYSHDAPRRFYTMEFNVRYAGLRNRLSFSSGFYDCKSRPQPSQV